jgi:hypothetical protein
MLMVYRIIGWQEVEGAGAVSVDEDTKFGSQFLPDVRVVVGVV